MSDPMQRIARDLMDEFFPHPGLHVGGRFVHPTESVITITSGYYLDPVYGRLSNHWHWTREDGSKGNGYGGPWPKADS